MVMLYPQDERINILAPIVRGRKGEFKKELAALRGRGFTKARIDGQFRALDEDPKLDRRRNHSIEVVVDRLIVRGGIERRLTESVEMALNLADDVVVINSFDGGDRLFSRKLACVDCGLSMPEMTPRAFSVQLAARRVRRVSGSRFDHRHRSAPCGAGRIEVAGRGSDRAVAARRSQARAGDAAALSRNLGIDLTAPFGKLPGKLREVILFGAGTEAGGSSKVCFRTFDVAMRTAPWAEQAELEPYRSLRPCPVCRGERLKTQSLSVKVKWRTIADYVDMPIAESVTVFDALQLSDREAIIAERILREIQERLRFLNDVGVGYSHARPERRHFVGGRGPAHPAGHSNWREPDWRACTCSTSRRSASINATTANCSRHWRGCATSGTPSSSWSMTRKPFGRPTM